MTKRLLSIILILLMSLVPSVSYSAFMDWGWGARPAGMGGAFTAIADDANAPLWNPAGSAQKECCEVSFMYARPYLGMTGVNLGLNYASALLSTSGNAFGISWSNFSSSGQYAENTFCFSYSHMVSRGLFTGFNMKYMGHSFTTDADTRNDPVFDGGLSSKYGFESDVGVLLKLDDKFAIGAAGKNLLQADMGLLDPDVTEREIRGGAALYPSDNITAALDVGYRAEKLLISCGGEAWLPDGKIGLRGGANMREGSLCEITFGASYKERMGNDKALRIDYCFVYPVSIAGFVTSHRVAVSMEF